MQLHIHTERMSLFAKIDATRTEATLYFCHLALGPFDGLECEIVCAMMMVAMTILMMLIYYFRIFLHRPYRVVIRYCLVGLDGSAAPEKHQ